MSPTILFEDDDIVVLDKPSGMLSIPDRFDEAAPTLSTWLKARYGDIFVVHRLDRETSGVILFAKHADAHRALNAQFETHTARKRYEAVVDGIVEPPSGTIDLPIGPHPRQRGMMCVDMRNGKPSVTHYTAIARYRTFSHLSLELETGRQHQIRVHCLAIGHPLAVDALYGKRAALLLSSFKKNYHGSGEERPLIARLTLHAADLTFTHPRTQLPQTVSAPLPKDLTALLRQIARWN